MKITNNNRSYKSTKNLSLFTKASSQITLTTATVKNISCLLYYALKITNNDYCMVFTLHSCGVMLWYFGQPDKVWCISNFPVMWPSPLQPDVGHLFTLFIDFLSLVSSPISVKDAKGKLSALFSTGGFSNTWIFLGLPRFFLTTGVCVSGSRRAWSSKLFVDAHSGQIVEMECLSTDCE